MLKEGAEQHVKMSELAHHFILPVVGEQTEGCMELIVGCVETQTYTSLDGNDKLALIALYNRLWLPLLRK